MNGIDIFGTLKKGFGKYTDYIIFRGCFGCHEMFLIRSHNYECKILAEFTLIDGKVDIMKFKHEYVDAIHYITSKHIQFGINSAVLSKIKPARLLDTVFGTTYFLDKLTNIENKVASYCNAFVNMTSKDITDNAIDNVDIINVIKLKNKVDAAEITPCLFADVEEILELLDHKVKYALDKSYGLYPVEGVMVDSDNIISVSGYNNYPIFIKIGDNYTIDDSVGYTKLTVGNITFKLSEDISTLPLNDLFKMVIGQFVDRLHDNQLIRPSKKA